MKKRIISKTLSGSLQRLITDFSSATMEAVGWYIQVVKEKDYQPRILYPKNYTFKTEGEIKTFPINKNRESLLPVACALK